jgi:hypothetical protein
MTQSSIWRPLIERKSSFREILRQSISRSPGRCPTEEGAALTAARLSWQARQSTRSRIRRCMVSLPLQTLSVRLRMIVLLLWVHAAM